MSPDALIDALNKASPDSKWSKVEERARRYDEAALSAPSDPGAQGKGAWMRALFEDIGNAVAEVEVSAVQAGNEAEALGAKKALAAVSKIRTAALAASASDAGGEEEVS